MDKHTAVSDTTTLGVWLEKLDEGAMVGSLLGFVGLAVVGVHLAVGCARGDDRVQLQLRVERKALADSAVQVNRQCRNPQDWPK